MPSKKLTLFQPFLILWINIVPLMETNFWPRFFLPIVQIKLASHQAPINKKIDCVAPPLRGTTEEREKSLAEWNPGCRDATSTTPTLGKDGNQSPHHLDHSANTRHAPSRRSLV